MIDWIKNLFNRNIAIRGWVVVIGLSLIPYAAHGIAVSALTALTGANSATGDLFVVVDISEVLAADRTKNMTRDELAAGIALGFANDAISGDDIEGGTIGAVTVGTLTLTNDLAVTQGGTGVSTLTDLITTTEILADTILEVDLDAVDTPTDEECLTFESGAGGDFEWQACGDPDQTITLTGDVTGSGTGSFAATIAANSVALTTDTTGNYVETVAAGDGISIAEADSEGATKTVVASLGTSIITTEITDDTILEVDLDAVDTPTDEECLTFESGAGGDFEWQACGDPDQTITLTGDVTGSGTGSFAATIAANAVALTTDTTGNYAAGDAEAGAALTGDSATSFFSAGTIAHERGGLEADVSAFGAGLYGQSAGFATIDVDTEAELETALGAINVIVSTEIDTEAEVETLSFGGGNVLLETEIDASSELAAIMDDETGTGLLVFGTSPTFLTGITVPANSISDEELDEGATFNWTGAHDFASTFTSRGIDDNADANAITISSDEEVTMSLQPCFLVFNSVTDNNQTGNGNVATVDFNIEVFDQSTDFSADTFTAPITGRYFLATSIRFEGITSAADSGFITIVTSNRSYRGADSVNTNDLASVRTFNLSVITDMDATDTATVTIRIDGESTDVVDITGASSPLVTMFSGCLLA